MILKVDMAGDVPIYQQIRNQIIFGIATGRLQAGEQLPTVRQLAGDLGVNPMTVNKAYALLKAEGAIVIDRRHGAKVCALPAKKGFPDESFNQRAESLLAEALLSGVSRDALENYMHQLIDKLYKQKEVSP